MIKAYKIIIKLLYHTAHLVYQYCCSIWISILKETRKINFPKDVYWMYLISKPMLSILKNEENKSQGGVLMPNNRMLS